MDQGPGTAEFKFASIEFTTSPKTPVRSRFGCSDLDLANSDPEKNAIAWFDFISVSLSGQIGGKLVIEI